MGRVSQHKLFWLAFKVGDNYRLCPYRTGSRQAAMQIGMECFLDRELVAVFSDEIGFSFEEMLDLARVMPPPGSLLWRPEVH